MDIEADIAKYSAQIITALVGAGATALATWVRSYKARKKREKALTAPRAISAGAEIYSALNYLLNHTDAVRVLFLIATNGGGIPKGSRQMYSSVIHELHTSEVDSVKHAWQRQPLDMQYLVMLEKTYKHGAVYIFTEEMQEGDLKDVYLATGIASSVVVPVASTQTEYMYLSLNFTENYKPARDDPKFRNTLRTGLQKIHRAVKQQYKNIAIIRK